jgi:hypothetical protein
MSGDDEGVMFDRASANQIVAMVRAWERETSGASPKRGRGPTIILPTRNALVTTLIQARSGPVKGKGNATLYCDDQTGSGNMVAFQTGAVIWNSYGATIATATWIVVGIVDGLIQVLGSDCPSS